ncbi:zinc knuckle CX2CX4HX4C containing protein, partial [Tanacetum coccineum]
MDNTTLKSSLKSSSSEVAGLAAKVRNIEGKIRMSVSNSFASVLQHKHTKKTVVVSELRNNEQVEGAAVVIPIKAVKEVSLAFDNMLYGYFIGKRLAFPLVENYFSTREGIEKVLESGPWLVHLVPLILNIWSPNAKLIKDKVRVAPVWVKLHNVPILAYSEHDPWEKCTYARVLIEMKAEMALLDTLVVAIPFNNGKGHSLDTIEVEYEWRPPRCAT